MTGPDPALKAPPAPKPLDLRLEDGRTATLSLAAASTALAVDQTWISSYDLGGRPFALVRDGWTWRRSLDGRWLRKGYLGGPHLRHLRKRLGPEEGEGVVEAARAEAVGALVALWGRPDVAPELRAEAERRLRHIVSMDGRALARDASRFASVYGPVGILPPDQYLSCVVQVTEGCSWNACTFCDFYRGTPFRVKTEVELAEHVAAVKAFFGESLALRPRVFLGAANALCAAHSRLLPLVELVAQAFGPPGGLFAFVDVWTGYRKPVEEYRAYAGLGLRRVYLGLESGDPALLSWLDKPGYPEDAVSLVERLRDAGISVGVIVLIGAGGERFFETHAARTAAVLRAMRLRPDDLVYFADLVEHPGAEYARRAAADGIAPLGPARLAAQRRAIAGAVRGADPAHPPRMADYDICEFVY